MNSWEMIWRDFVVGERLNSFVHMYEGVLLTKNPIMILLLL
jgi:hypothetical protein